MAFRDLSQAVRDSPLRNCLPRRIAPTARIWAYGANEPAPGRNERAAIVSP